MSLENPLSSPEKKPEKKPEKETDKKPGYVEGDPSRGISVGRLGDNLSEEDLEKIEKMKERREKKDM